MFQTYTRLTDERKMVLRARKVSGASEKRAPWFAERQQRVKQAHWHPGYKYLQIPRVIMRSSRLNIYVFAGVVRAELWSVAKPSLSWLFKKPMKAEVVWSKRNEVVWSKRNVFINVVSNVNKSQCQAQILILTSNFMFDFYWFPMFFV